MRLIVNSIKHPYDHELEDPRCYSIKHWAIIVGPINKLWRYSPTNRSLRENVSIECSQRQTDICLREAELYSSLFELLGELL